MQGNHLRQFGGRDQRARVAFHEAEFRQGVANVLFGEVLMPGAASLEVPTGDWQFFSIQNPKSKIQNQ